MTGDEKPPDPLAAAVAGGMAAILSVTTPVLDTVAGYKRAAVASGFPDDVADDMARVLHALLFAEFVTPLLRSMVTSGVPK